MLVPLRALFANPDWLIYYLGEEGAGPELGRNGGWLSARMLFSGAWLRASLGRWGASLGASRSCLILFLKPESPRAFGGSMSR